MSRQSSHNFGEEYHQSQNPEIGLMHRIAGVPRHLAEASVN